MWFEQYLGNKKINHYAVIALSLTFTYYGNCVSEDVLLLSCRLCMEVESMKHLAIDRDVE